MDMFEVQTAIHKAIEQRYPSESSADVIARAVCKLIEEVGEVARELKIVPEADKAAVRDVFISAESARRDAQVAFHAPDWEGTVESIDFVKVRAEVTDVFIVLMGLATQIENVTGQPFDLALEAIWKAQADIQRSLINRH